MNVLVLEDDSYRISTFIDALDKDNIKIADNAIDAIYYLDNYVFDLLFLDHDLGIDNGCGQDVASYLYKNSHNDNNKAIIVIHSWNTYAVSKMISYLPNAVHIPFTKDIITNLKLDNII